MTRLRAFELARYDVIRLEDRPMRLLDDPETVHRGLGLFDDFQLLVGMRCVDARSPDAGPEYLVLDPEETVLVYRRAVPVSGCGDAGSRVAGTRRAG